MAAVKLDDKWGFVNKNGKVAIPCIYDEVYSFSGGLTTVKLDRKWGVINKQGKFVLPCVYGNIYWAIDYRVTDDEISWDEEHCLWTIKQNKKITGYLSAKKIYFED